MALILTYEEFGVPGPVDILLGADAFNCVIHHGQCSSPAGSPAALETSSGCIVTGCIHSRPPLYTATGNGMLSSHTSNELLQKFWGVENCNLPEPVLSTDEQMFVNHFHTSYS